jgi:dUTP pyrophosphatase
MTQDIPMIHVAIHSLDHARDLLLPSYATPQSAGMDLSAAIFETITLKPGQRSLVPTGLIIALPKGYEAQIRPRSGLALKHGITVLNTPGTIDADYRGEIQVILINHGETDFTIERGMRIAQMVIAPFTQITLENQEQPFEGEHRGGGFGSTGIHSA